MSYSRIRDTEEFHERVEALRPTIGLLPARMQVQRAMIKEEIRLIWAETQDPMIERLCALLEEIADA